MQVNYGMAAKATLALGVLAANYNGNVSKNTMKHAITFLGASVLAQRGTFCNQKVCNQVATVVQLYAGLDLLAKAVVNSAPVSVKEWTVDYMNPLRNVIASAALATVFANRNININKY